MPSKNSAVSKALVAYIPALHAGYISFLKKHRSCDLYVLDRALTSITPRMERDIRALAPKESVAVLKALKILRSVSLLTKSDIKKLNRYKEIILPDEDVSRNFAERYLAEKKTTFQSIFLRWDKNSALAEVPVSPDRIVSTNAKDIAFLRGASRAATRSADWWRQIGAVAVQGGEIIFRAYNRHFPSDGSVNAMGDPRSNFDYGEAPDVYTSIHAESDVIAQAAKEGVSLKGASIYVTTFPCANCARLLARAEVKKVYYGKGYSRVDAEGVLRSANIEIIQVKDA